MFMHFFRSRFILWEEDDDCTFLSFVLFLFIFFHQLAVLCLGFFIFAYFSLTYTHTHKMLIE